MRLEEWQRFIESQFLDDDPAKQAHASARSASTPLERDLERSPDPHGRPVLFPEFFLEEPDLPAFERYLPPSRREGSPLQKDLDALLSPGNTAKASQHGPARARRARKVPIAPPAPGVSLEELWARVPRHIQTLLAMETPGAPEIAQNSYKRPFAEQRRELIERLLDPILTLEQVARLLNVCPATVRRYTNQGLLNCFRKEPECTTEVKSRPTRETRQRRFRLSDVVAFLETQQNASSGKSPGTAPREGSTPGGTPPEHRE
ncbi:MAG: helix-turn-helix domain-containing protein [Chloroherpetonaceae bacterium]|nr:helix-turn-helix domain-containing protein [Chthonomonadaceae bacterium]MDW8207520.1 helix-turn-helix domain-containing protein [Chloroherpetonaceae bacterium]